MTTSKTNRPDVDRAQEPGFDEALLRALREFDTCTMANAIERCGVRMRNEGFTRPGLHCFTPVSERLIGYAATCRIRSSDPPMAGRIEYLERSEWWSAIETVRQPRIAVIQDLEPDPVGSSVGAVHAAILKAFHCEGVITNGAVRDLPEVERMSFSMYARHAAVSHSYAHLVDYGTEVDILGLPVRTGDLLLADRHGAVVIPTEIAAELPRVASEIRTHEQRIIDLCLSPEFTTEKLLYVIRSGQ
jgi:4-hydroxy-4-methyl-2-oxoglutarate aldolase